MYPKTLSIFIIFTTTITQTHSLDPKFEGCAPQSCGNLSSIRYPFWISNKQEPYCGHPSLKITCENDEIPIIQISIDDHYIITHIDYPNHKFHLANSILFNHTISCPTPLHNITLNQTLLNFSNDYVEFFLFYNCSSLPKDFNVIFPISCGDNGSNKSFGDFHGEVLAKYNYSFALCQSVVVAPVDAGASLGLGYGGSSTSSLWNMSYEQILSQGFTLNWTAHDCGGCERSGGHCGFSGEKFVCFCRDKPYSQSCHHGKEVPKIKIIIGVGVAASGSILVACLACFIYTQRHKWKNNNIKGSKHEVYSAQKNYRSSSNTSYSSSAQSEVQSINGGSTYFGVQLFSYRELEQATHFFDPSNELGDGGFGTVYYAKLGDGREVAIKKLYENNNKRAQQFMNEVEILAHLRHHNLVTLYGCTSRQSRDLLLVYEYVPNGTVADHLHGQKAKAGPLPWPTRLSIAIETARALLYLHASDIIHRDVKTQNILLDKDFSVKVADFGLSRLFPLDVTHVSTAPQGTPGYVDPEYYQCYHLTEKSDVYSFGVMLAELLSSMPAVDITRRRQDINLSNMAIDKIQNNALHELVDPSLGFESDFRVKKEITAVAELAFRCLQGTREMRPSMDEVLETLRGVAKKVDMADVVDIPYDDMNMLKSDLSPNSTQMDDNSSRGYKLHTSA